MVIAALMSLVAKEVNCVVADSSGLGSIGLQMTKTIRLVPTARKDVERNLATYRESVQSLSIERDRCEAFESLRQAQVREFLPENRNEGLADLVDLVKRFKFVSFLKCRVTTMWTDVHHSIPELHKGPSLDGNVEVCDVVQDEVDKFLVLGLAEKLDE